MDRGEVLRKVENTLYNQVLADSMTHAAILCCRPGAESVFLCDEESEFYGNCVQELVFDRSRNGRTQVNL